VTVSGLLGAAAVWLYIADSRRRFRAIRMADIDERSGTEVERFVETATASSPACEVL